MEDFPLLQASTSCNPTPKRPRLPHNLDLINGIRIVRDTLDLPGQIFNEDDLVIYDPAWTYGQDKINDPTRREKREEPRFVPNYVLFAQKCLKFHAYFRRDIDSFLNQRSNIRNVTICYFLEDDTMSVIEPVSVNAGCNQGKLVQRAKIPKDEFTFYHWKDLNVGLKINIYGTNYHLVDCDAFTRNFLTSQGIDVDVKQELPTDINYESHQSKIISKPQLYRDTQYRFLNQDEINLTFVASWNEDKYAIYYHLADDTISIRRIPRSKDDDDPMSKVLLRRMKLVKSRELEINKYVESIGFNQPSTDEFKYSVGNKIEYYGPEDFKVGETVTILGRQFHLIDCNYLTRKFYLDKLGINQPPGILHETESETSKPIRSSFQRRTLDQPFSKRAYAGITKRDAVIRQLLNLNTKLRYSMKMDAVYPEDEDRQFILEYNLGDGTIAINEIESKNCGRSGGSFLSPTVIAKPGSNEDEPEYYSEQDFYIGAKLNIFNHHFIITGADLAVWKYIQEHLNAFNEEFRNNMIQYFSKKEDVKKDNEEIEKSSKNLCNE